MKLLTSIYTIDEIENLIDSIDYALINVPKLSISYKDIDLDKAILFLKKNNKGIVLSINKIMHPADVLPLEKFILKYKDSEVLFYTADFGSLALFIKYNIINRVIYNPETMVTNYLDLGEFYSLGLNSIGLSSEITLNDLKLMNSKTNARILYQTFGYRLMFYSKRKLVSLYEKQANINVDKHDLYLKESTRNDYFPIIENDNGTLIYRSYLISLLDKLSELDFLEFAYVESTYVDKDIFKRINELFYDSIKNKNNLSKNIEELKLMNLNIEDGFLYKDSVYQKEELKNE
ncbi:MAG: U32 family peptidase [Acholeplasmatales bacterium]|nr:U32 family peptidase [Acholeplasmatales bacterium]